MCNQIPPAFMWVGWALMASLFLVLALKLNSISCYKNQYLLGLTAWLIIFFGGMMRVTWTPLGADEGIADISGYWAEVVEPVRKYPTHYQSTLAISLAGMPGNAQISDDRIRSFQRLDTHKPLRYGDRVLITGAPSPIAPPANPYQFNYRKFLQRKGIQWQHWIEDDQIISLQQSSKRDVLHIVWGLHNYFKGRIEKYITSAEAREITAAMLLGSRHDLSEPVETAFAQSGTMHILAVSGLHLGIIYGFIVYLFGTWRFRKRGKWVFLTLTLLALWTFAMLTGLAPSTRRSAIMFSVLLIGNIFGRRGNSYNAWALSACIILLLDPYELYAVGFQLSFIALIGILYLQPKIAAWWSPRGRVVRYCWDIVTVSLSAQLAVFPLSLYYFHQAPSYFLLGNLIMVPLTLVILLTGFLFLLTGFSLVISSKLGVLVTVLAEGSLQINRFIGSLPASTISNIWIDHYQLIISYLLMIAAIGFLINLRWYFLKIFMALWLTALLFSAFKSTFNRADRIVVYQIKGHTALDLIRGGQYDSYASAGLTIKQIKYNIHPYRGRLGLRPAAVNLADWSNDDLTTWMFQGKLVILVKRPLGKYRGPPIKVDLLIIANNSIQDLASLQEVFICSRVVADGSNRQVLVNDLRLQARKYGLFFHGTQEEGGVVINIKRN